QRAVRWAGAAAQHAGDAAHQRFFDLLRRDEVDVRVHAAGGEDLALAGDRFGRRPDDNGDAGLRVGVAGLADTGDTAVLEADIGLVDAGMVDDQRVGDDGVHRAFGTRRLGLSHAVADHLAAAELHLFAVNGEIAFHLDDEVGVGEPDLVARGRAVHVGIGGAGDAGGHGNPSVEVRPRCLPHAARGDELQARLAGVAGTFFDVAVEGFDALLQVGRRLAPGDQRHGEHLEYPHAARVAALLVLVRLVLEQPQQRVIGGAVGPLLEVGPVAGAAVMRQLVGVKADEAAQLALAAGAAIEVAHQRNQLLAEDRVAIDHTQRQSFPMIFCWNPNTVLLPLSGTSRTSRDWPGSKRTAVPAAISSRMPRALSRSNFRPLLVS